jgi:hypothetical protein
MLIAPYLPEISLVLYTLQNMRYFRQMNSNRFKNFITIRKTVHFSISNNPLAFLNTKLINMDQLKFLV